MLGNSADTVKALTAELHDWRKGIRYLDDDTPDSQPLVDLRAENERLKAVVEAARESWRDNEVVEHLGDALAALDHKEE
jgi:hypothetical protein